MIAPVHGAVCRVYCTKTAGMPIHISKLWPAIFIDTSNCFSAAATILHRIAFYSKNYLQYLL